MTIRRIATRTLLEGTQPSYVEQLRDQHLELTKRGFAIPRQLVITTADASVEHLVVQIAPSLRVRMDGLLLDSDAREMLELAVRDLGVRSITVLVDTQSRQVGEGGVAPEPFLPRANRELGAYHRMQAAAGRAGRRFAEARAILRTFCLDLSRDPSLRAPDARKVTCCGVIYVAESGVTHLFAPEADHFAVLD